MEFTYFGDQGNVLMVGVKDRAEIKREAMTRGGIFISPQCLEKMTQGTMAKGDVSGVARVAGIIGTKRTSELIPLCHILNLTRLTVDSTIKEESNEIEAVCTTRITGKIGVEMEALTGVSVAPLAVYDTCKAVDKPMEIGDIYLEHKSGGRSREFHNPRRIRSKG